MTPALSVVIPTHDRPDILRRCVEHIARQTVSADLEVIVVCDANADASKQACLIPSSTRACGAFNVQFLPVPPCHQGVARNRGVALAAAPLTLFIGDDIFLEPEACGTHIAAHRSGRAAVLGFTTWDPSIGITPVMRWLEKSGWQFGYPLLRPYDHDVIPADMQHRFTYTSNISLPTEIARAHPFREDATLYGWEDIEWGMRLRAAGVPLRYESGARGLHHHRITLAESLERMRTLGASAVLMERMHMGFDRVPRGIKRALYEAAALLPTMAGRHRRAFLEGIGRAGKVQQYNNIAI